MLLYRKSYIGYRISQRLIFVLIFSCLLFFRLFMKYLKYLEQKLEEKEKLKKYINMYINKNLRKHQQILKNRLTIQWNGIKGFWCLVAVFLKQCYAWYFLRKGIKIESGNHMMQMYLLSIGSHVAIYFPLNPNCTLKKQCCFFLHW